MVVDKGALLWETEAWSFSIHLSNEFQTILESALQGMEPGFEKKGGGLRNNPSHISKLKFL